MQQALTLATEGFDDEAVARKICATLGISVAHSYPARGKTKLDPKIRAYNQAAALAPWLVLRDLDADDPCQAIPQQNHSGFNGAAGGILRFNRARVHHAIG